MKKFFENISGFQEKNKDLEKNKSSDPTIKERLDIALNYLFKRFPKLKEIGSKKQYYEYLQQIFPDSLVKDIVYHGCKKFSRDSGHISGYDNIEKHTFFTDNLKYAQSYAKYRGGSLVIPAVLDIQKPASDDNLDGLFGKFGEDPNSFLGYSGLKDSFDAYISKPNYDTPLATECYTNDSSYKEDKKLSREKEKTAIKININEITPDFIVDRNYAIYGDLVDRMTQRLDNYKIKYNRYSVNTIDDILYIDNEESVRKIYQNITYLVFNENQIHFLGDEKDLKGFAEYMKQI